MIPIRNFPYSDYHDLNLDFILSKYASFISDIESLNDRVTALENWRAIAEPDIASIKSRLTTVESQITSLNTRLTTAESNITSLGSRVTTAETNINALANNPAKYFITAIDSVGGSITIRKNSLDAEPLSNYSEFINDLLNSSTTTKGIKTARVYRYIASEGSFHLFECDYYIESLTGTLGYIHLSAINRGLFNDYPLSIRQITMSYNPSSGTLSTFQEESYEGRLTKTQTVNITSAGCVSNDDPNLSSDYPYKFVVNNENIGTGTMVNIYLDSSSDFITYSDKICQFVKTVNNKYEIYLTEPITVSLKAYIT